MPDDRERAEHLPVRLRADEQRDADEADRDADEPQAGDADVAEEAEGDARALKIGTAPWMIDARPESIRVSPHESSQNGMAMLRDRRGRASRGSRGSPSASRGRRP